MSQLHRLSFTVMSTTPTKTHTDVRVEDAAALLEILLDQGEGMTVVEVTRTPVTVCWCGDTATYINTASDVVEEHPTCTAHLRDGYRDLPGAKVQAPYVECAGCGHHGRPGTSCGTCGLRHPQTGPAPKTLPSYATSPGTTYLSRVREQATYGDALGPLDTGDVLDALVEALTYSTPATSTGSTGWSAAPTPLV